MVCKTLISIDCMPSSAFCLPGLKVTTLALVSLPKYDMQQSILCMLPGDRCCRQRKADGMERVPVHVQYT